LFVDERGNRGADKQKRGTNPSGKEKRSVLAVVR